MPTLDMHTAIIAATLIDLVAVAALVWLTSRTRRERDETLAEQRTALERLKGDLGKLLEDAERRARALEETLALREDGLRTARALPAGARPRQDRPPVAPGSVRTMTGGTAETARRAGIDPAEARLIRDLEVSLQRPRTA